MRRHLPLLLAAVAIPALACALAPQPAPDPAPTDAPPTPQPAETDPHGVKHITIQAGERVTSQNARCTMADVRTDDLASANDEAVPKGAWPSASLTADDRCGDDLETLAFRLLNCEREARDLPALRCDLRMVWLGRQHAADMRKYNFLSHTSHNGASPFARMKARSVRYRAAAENICQAPDVEQAHFVWMDSEGHRLNILSPEFTFAGVGVVQGKDGLLLTTDFYDPFPADAP